MFCCSLTGFRLHSVLGADTGSSSKVCQLGNAFLSLKRGSQKRLFRSRKSLILCNQERRFSVTSSHVRIKEIPILSDNYSYLIIDDSTKAAAVIDPAEPKKIIEAAKKENVKLSTVLTTHHHWDHAGGNEELSRLLPGIEIVGNKSDADRIPALTKAVSENDIVTVDSMRFKVLFTPCHTRGHILYFLEDGPSSPALFSGDTLFVAGCGRFFEGDAADMYRALYEVVGALPDSTQVFCGHEYTLTNLRFAASIEPTNEHVAAKLAWANQQRSRGLPTIPSTIADERRTNPFMRVHTPALAQSVGISDPVSVMAELRRRKDRF